MPPPALGGSGGWRVVGRRGRSVAGDVGPAAAATPATAEDDGDGPGAGPPAPPGRCGRRTLRPRTHAEVVADVVAAVQHARVEVEASSFWRSLQHRMREAEQDFEEWAGPDAPYPWDWGGVVRLAVLGLGSPEARAPPRHQAALALAMAARLPGLQGKPLVSDPVFSAADVDALGALGFDVVSPAAACAPPPTPGASLAYLPHCEAALAEAVLEAHWSPNSLPRLALLGNSLTYVAARWDVAGAGPGGSAVTGGGAPPTAPPPRRPHDLHAGARPDRVLTVAARPGCLLEAACGARAPAARGDALGPAFNDTALHLFPRWPDGEGGGEGGESDKRE